MRKQIEVLEHHPDVLTHLIFRPTLASFVLDFWPLQLLAAGYLLWLCVTNLAGSSEAGVEATSTAASTDAAPAAQRLHGQTLGSVVATLAVTDLAFSLDSVAAAVAVSDRLWLVMTGGVIGVVALRLTAGLFIRWLEEYRHLERAGYLAVGLVGVRLLLRLALPQIVPPEWALLLVVACLFVWGFSQRSQPQPQTGEVNP